MNHRYIHMCMYTVWCVVVKMPHYAMFTYIFCFCHFSLDIFLCRYYFVRFTFSTHILYYSHVTAFRFIFFFNTLSTLMHRPTYISTIRFLLLAHDLWSFYCFQKLHFTLTHKQRKCRDLLSSSAFLFIYFFFSQFYIKKYMYMHLQFNNNIAVCFGFYYFVLEF